MSYEITSEHIPIPPADPGGRPERSKARRDLLNEAAADTARAGYGAAKQIHAGYYGELAKTSGEEYQNQLRYLSKEINKLRRGNLQID